MKHVAATDLTASRTVDDLTVRPLAPAAVDAFVDARDGSFLQLSRWAGVKDGWAGECVGWHAGDGDLLGVGTVLYRRVPHTRRSLAYLPEGPCLPWADVTQAPQRWLGPLADHVRSRGAFTLRIGVTQVRSTWSAGTTRNGLAAPAVGTFRDLQPDTADLGAALWVPETREPSLTWVFASHVD